MPASQMQVAGHPCRGNLMLQLPDGVCGGFCWPPQPTTFARLRRRRFQQLLSVLTGARRRYGRYFREPMGDRGKRCWSQIRDSLFKPGPQPADKGKGIYDGSATAFQSRSAPMVNLGSSFWAFGQQADRRATPRGGESDRSAKRSGDVRGLGYLQDLSRRDLQPV